ncbi:MAG: hydrogenase maturation protease [Steroidobacteraceae bacterium]
MSGSTAPRRVIGVGNPDRGDDGAGPACIAALRARLASDVELIRSDGEPAALLALLEGSSEVYLIDACAAGLPAGGIRRWNAAVRPLPARAGSPSSHGLGLAEALELARALGVLPARCVVYGIEGRSYEAGEPLSVPVRAAVESVARRIERATAR